MSQHHPSSGRRSCGLCKPHKRRGTGRSHRDPAAVRRALGRTRRYDRHDTGL